MLCKYLNFPKKLTHVTGFVVKGSFCFHKVVRKHILFLALKKHCFKFNYTLVYLEEKVLYKTYIEFDSL